MNKLIILVLGMSVLFSCQEQEKRYTTSSPEIDMAKKSIAAYEAGNWEVWTSKFSDDAEIFHNNWNKSKSVEKAVEDHISMLKNFKEYGYLNEPIFFEMIIENG